MARVTGQRIRCAAWLARSAPRAHSWCARRHAELRREIRDLGKPGADLDVSVHGGGEDQTSIAQEKCHPSSRLDHTAAERTEPRACERCGGDPMHLRQVMRQELRALV